MKGFVLAGSHSGVGKTTISMGLMKLLSRKYDLAAFKVGPDYIDPSFHSWVTGHASYNLDAFLMGEGGVNYSFQKHRRDCNIVEGVMGLFDGASHDLDNASTAHVARILNLPVVLVLDGARRSTSLAAEVLGYQMMDPRLKIAGVIINRLASEKSYDYLKEAIELHTKLPCLGYVLMEKRLELSSRHLGLLQADEVEDLEAKLELLADALEKSIDMEALEAAIEVEENKVEVEHPLKAYKEAWKGKKMAIAKDKAFRFYYQDNLEALEYIGMEISYFSPLETKTLPESDFYYFGGGYPELFAKELEENKELAKEIRETKAGIYAECGGFMYLGKSFLEVEGKEWNFVSLLETTTKMKNRLQIGRFGYLHLMDGEEEVARGHEFHYSNLEDVGEEERGFVARKDNGREWPAVFTKEGRIFAGYPHIHFFQAGKYLERLFRGGQE